MYRRPGVGPARRSGFRGIGGGALAWSPNATAPLVWLDNQAASEDALASVLDRSGNGRHFAVSGTSSARPRGLPMNMAFGARPAIRFDGSDSTWAQAPGVVGDWPAWHTADFTILVEGYAHVWTGTDIPFVTTWGIGTSNENSIFFGTHGSNFHLRAYITSTTGGGSVHLSSAVTSNGTLRPGDRFTAIWRRSGTTSRLYLRRRARWAGYSGVPADTDAVSTDTDTITGTINTGAHVAVPVIGANRSTSGTFASVDISDVMMWNRSITDAELDQLVAWAAARYDFPWVDYVASRPLIVGAGGDLGVAAGGGADNLHPNDTGQAKFGDNMHDADVALVAALGLSGTVRIATCGDSRMDGSNASVGGTTGRAVRAAAASGWTDTPVGPVSSAYGGSTFARSGGIERAHAKSASPGFSYRSPGTYSIDAYMGVSALYTDVDIAHFLLGVNDLNAAIGPFLARDHLYERFLSAVYMRDRVQAEHGHDMGVHLLNEPSSAITTTGALQRETFARNREYHALVRALRAQGIETVLSNVHDDTYNP